MTSRVVHARLPDKTIAGCIDIMQGNGLQTQSIPISTMVSKTLTACIKDLINKGMIPDRTPEEIDELMSTTLDVVETSMDKLPSIDMTDAGPTIIKPLIDNKLSKLDSIVSDVLSGDAGTDEPIFNENYKEPTHDDLAKGKTIRVDKKMPFDEIKELAPKDRLVEASVNSPEMQNALEIVYAQLAPSLWGTDIAERNVKSILEVMKK